MCYTKRGTAAPQKYPGTFYDCSIVIAVLPCRTHDRDIALAACSLSKIMTTAEADELAKSGEFPIVGDKPDFCRYVALWLRLFFDFD